MLLAWLLSLSVIGVTVVIHSAGLGALMHRLNTLALAPEGVRHSSSIVMPATVVGLP